MTFNYELTFIFYKGPFIIYGRGWAGKNELGGGGVTQNSRQFEGGGGNRKYANRCVRGSLAI